MSTFETRILARLGLLAIVLYAVGRVYFFAQTRSANIPLILVALAYFGVLFTSIGLGGRVGLGISIALVGFHLGIFYAANDQAVQSPELRLLYNVTLVLMAVVPGYLSDLNRKLLLAVQAQKQSEDELRQKNQELERLVRIDPLTQVLNRRAFYDVAEKIFALAKRHRHTFGVVLLDLDHFKQINDTYGHAAGDQALKQITACIQSSARASDLIARFGGEEFVILLPETDGAGAAQFATKLEKEFKSLAISFGNGMIRVSGSMGVTALNSEDKDLDSVIARADGAMYRAKELERNHIIAR